MEMPKSFKSNKFYSLKYNALQLLQKNSTVGFDTMFFNERNIAIVGKFFWCEPANVFSIQILFSILKSQSCSSLLL